MANRKIDKILLKKSGVIGKVPTALDLGELALNFADMKLYGSGTTANSIIPIGWDRISRTGDTVTGNFNFNGNLFAQTLSATTYLGLPKDVFVTGGTYSSASTTVSFVNNTGGTFNVTGFSNMYKSVYDTDNDGIVDMAESLITYFQTQETITIGDPVYISSTGTPSFIKRSKQNTPSTLPAIGIAMESANGGQTIKVVLYGRINSLNTNGYSLNQILYVSPSGGLTGIKPVSSAQPIAIVFRVGGSDGIIGVSPQSIFNEDIYVTGGTYSSGTATFTNNTGGTFSVSGFSTGGASSLYWSGGTGTNSIIALGSNNIASGDNSLAEGFNTTASGFASHAEGFGTVAEIFSHAEGRNTTASGFSSHSEGQGTIAGASYSHAEGFDSKAIGTNSHAEGENTTASGQTSHSEGYQTIAGGSYSHAEGYQTQANTAYSHAEGYQTQTNGTYSHAGGYQSQANSVSSFIHGYNSQVNGDYSIVLGREITGDTADTTYVDRLNIKTVPSGTSINNLGIDSNGRVIIGSSSSTIPVSATGSGIVNNVVLQELGGVDKLINEVRIGKGNGNNPNNLVYGYGTLATNTTGSYNVAIGSEVMSKLTTGSYNVGVGPYSLYEIISGSYNTAIGIGALQDNLGSFNDAFGAYALGYNSTGEYNTAIGNAALSENRFGSQNVAVGAYALYLTQGVGGSNSQGARCVAVGTKAMENNTTGNGTAIGNEALLNQTTGTWNIVIGQKAGSAITTGSNNIIITANGINPDSGISTGNNNLIISQNFGGANLNITSGSSNTVIGKVSGGLLVNTNNQVYIADGTGNVSGLRFKSDQNGLCTIPTQTNANITSDVDGYSIITKNYFNQNIPNRRKDITYFASGDIPQNTVLIGNFVSLLTKSYKLIEVSVVFGEQSMNTNKIIPFEIKTIDTDSIAPSATLQYTANCNALIGAIQNKVYTFDVDITLPANKLLTVNTGAFTASTQILKNCLVTLVLEEI